MKFGGMNLGQMMKQAQKMKEDMESAREELEDAEIEAASGGGAVTVVVNGNKELQSIKIKPEAVDPSDVEMLEDMILAAVNEANAKAQALHDEKMGMFGGLV